MPLWAWLTFAGIGVFLFTRSSRSQLRTSISQPPQRLSPSSAGVTDSWSNPISVGQTVYAEGSFLTSFAIALDQNGNSTMQNIPNGTPLIVTGISQTSASSPAGANVPMLKVTTPQGQTVYVLAGSTLVSKPKNV
ncbi:MAG: hypothetical protein ACHREM_18030 [Polyangiales bacterium]